MKRPRLHTLLLCLLVAGAALAPLRSASSLADPPAVHGMLVVGTERVYFSHLPMFHPPHQYQVILEAGLRAADAAAYRKDRARGKERLYTFAPRPFVLEERMKAGAAVRGDLYRGHYERGGEVLLRDIPVTVRRALHFRRLQAADPKPERYAGLLFGTPEEPFLAHRITSPPDYDQIVRVTVTPAPKPVKDPPAVEFRAAARENGRPLEVGETVEGRVGGGLVSVKVVDECYREAGELAE